MIIKNVKLEWTSVSTPNAMSGKYSTDFYFKDAEAQDAFIMKVDDAWRDHKGSFKGNPQSLGYVELDTGHIKFKATQAPKSGDGKYTFDVDVYDAKAKKLEPKPSIGNGTIANVDIEIYPYTFKNNKGVKLNLKAIQIIELVEYGQGNNFDAQDGYTAEPENNFGDTTAPSVEGI